MRRATLAAIAVLFLTWSVGSTVHAAPPTPDWMRTKTEWFSLRAHGGNYGGGLTISLFTLRWHWFYWEIVRGGGGSAGSPAGWGVAGTAFGVPVHLGTSGRHELRFGTGIFGGIAGQYNPGKKDTFSHGPLVLVEASYVWHAARRFALHAGMDLHIATTRVKGNDVPDPIFSVFAGFRI